MITVVFPDGARRSYPQGTNGLAVAESISKSLAKKAVAVNVNGKPWDLTRALPDEARIGIITRDSEEGLEVIRHDMAHVLAQAVKELYPQTQITIGPAIENGFYYDFHREKPFTPDDFAAIEERMRAIISRNYDFIREEWDRDEAVAFFKGIGEDFKAELIGSIPPGETVTLYRQGDFIDLCRGPHMPSTGMIGTAFKLMKVAGAYWRGDHRNPMLQRIYATGWSTKEQLDDYLHRLEEAQKRDHRKLGNELNLFHMQEEAPGSVFWHPKGWTIYRLLEQYIRAKLDKNGYVEVRTPQILDRSLWEASGHWEKFRENMFTVEAEDKVMAVKPMNCPCHVQIFKQGIKSYRDLPLRMAEFGCCHRNEPSGALHGLMRVRAFVQDDAHIFCTPEQIVGETRSFCTLLKEIYTDLGFTDVYVKFSDRPPVRAGSDAVWDQAEQALKEAAIASGLEFVMNPGEGAFYGPKLEFVLKDSIGRDWQCGTLQADFVLPERLDASYVGEDGAKHRPVMLHRAILGSLERFIGVLIEHYAGKFPLWLAPVQAVVASVTDEASEYAAQVCAKLRAAGIRCEPDVRNEKISYKIREHSLQKVPYILVAGKQEAADGTLAVRCLGTQEQRVLGAEDVLRELCEGGGVPS